MHKLLIGGLAAALYTIVGGLLATRLAQGRNGHPWPKGWLIALAAMACALHFVLLRQQILVADGFNLGFFNALSLAAWLGALLLVIASAARPVENLGIVLFPLSAIALLLPIAIPSEHLVANADPTLQVHILLSILSYALLAMACVQAILLAIQDRHLHNRRPGGFIRRLPPLVTMESLLFQMIAVGFVLLSLSLLTGILFLEDIFAQRLVHKTVLSIAAWVVFGVLLWGRWRFGWRGRAAIRWTISGFAALVLAYFGSKMVIELILVA